MADKLTDLRHLIDEVDKAIMDSLEKRFMLVKEIGDYKKENQLGITDSNRENMVIAKSNNYMNNIAIKNTYLTIINESKSLQQGYYYLVGKQLDYSYSPFLHNFFGNYHYFLATTDNFEQWYNNNNFSGINVTNPYKKAVMLKGVKSNLCAEIGASNTLTKKDENIFVDNYDYQALKNTLINYQIDLNNKKVLILGNGATSKTVYKLASDLQAKTITKLVRTIRAENEDYFLAIDKYADYNIIINTTSYGVFPHCEETPLIELGNLSNLEAVIDINYNPFRSALLLEAEKHNIIAVNGLLMLAECARLSEELWQNKHFPIALSKHACHMIEENMNNIVLIGMPYSGKTTISTTLAKILQRNCFDSDQLLFDKKIYLNSDLSNLAEFRKYEEKLIGSLSLMQNSIIATGGGIIENSLNIKRLKQNGLIIYINTDINILETRINTSRPLCKNNDDLLALHQKRSKKYQEAADIIININDESMTVSDVCQIIEVKLHEYYDNKWS